MREGTVVVEFTSAGEIVGDLDAGIAALEASGDPVYLPLLRAIKRLMAATP